MITRKAFTSVHTWMKTIRVVHKMKVIHGRGREMNKRELEEALKKHTGEIAEALLHGDVELRKSATGITVAEVRKKVIVRGDCKREQF